MEMCLERELEIEDLRDHSQQMIAHLRDALAGGAVLTPDPKRLGFYEAKDRKHIFYIYVSPNTGKVLLLAACSYEESLMAEIGVSA
ncbi:MAG TPA: hypothetical protein VN881_07560 [Candidatus Acidoferrales bacterium]|jgi:hypothetical protein|nr:hypothetical protein [Candidatus Acidoferrales bacterium]